MVKGLSLTLSDLTINEANSLLFVLDSLRSGKGVEVRVFEQGHSADCADGSCAVPDTSEPVAIDTPYKPNDDTVEATYEVDKKPKKRPRRAKKAPKEEQAQAEAFPEPSNVAPVVDAPAAPEPAPVPVVALPAVTKVDVDAALDAVFKKSGMTGARAILLEFAVVRSRDLKPEQYPAFIARANEIASR